MGVSGDHTHVLTAQDRHKVKELLADQGLDGGRVEEAAPRAQGEKAQPQRHERLAAARGRAQDHIVARHEVKQGLLLVGPQLDAAVGAPPEKEFQDLLAVGSAFGLLVGGHAVPGLPRQGDQTAEGGGVFCGLDLKGLGGVDRLVWHEEDLQGGM